jgi:hypothetical protein
LKHTQGLWEIDPEMRGGGYAIVTMESGVIGLAIQRDSGSGPNARIGITTEQTEANARVMMAGPRLLAALLLVKKWGIVCGDDAVHDEIDSAIAKATGDEQ